MKGEDIQLKQSQRFLSYLALQEIMLDNYEDIRSLKMFDNNIRLKHINMINSLKRKSSEAYRYLQGYDEGEEAIRQFHEFTRIFEGLHHAIDMGGDTLYDCMNEIEKILIRDKII
jgi:hypothetical protein